MNKLINQKIFNLKFKNFKGNEMSFFSRNYSNSSNLPN